LGEIIMSAVAVDDEALKFFNHLACTLRIRLGKPPSPVAPNMLNLKADADAKIASMSISTQVAEGDCENETRRDLTEAEWRRVVFRGPLLRLRGMGCERIFEHSAPDGATFTVRDLIAAMLETERQTRLETNWCGGINVHHIFFGGLSRKKDGSWEINWDS
jgi:hypothetical protein